jgi:hypothetical protein
VTPTTPACPGCGKVLAIDSLIQEFRYDKKGYEAEFPSSQPQMVTWRVLSSPSGRDGNHNFFVLLDDASDRASTADDNVITTFFMTSNNQMVMWDGSNSYTHPFTNDRWIEISLVIYWESAKIDWWVREWTGVAANESAWVNARNDIPFRSRATAINSIYLYSIDKARGFFDEVAFCNSATGPKYVPVSRTTAIQAATSKFRQTVNGKLDFSFEKEFSSYSFSQSHNYRLKGGDSSIVDLLDLRKTTDTFETWKRTIPINPAVVSYTLEEVSALFPDEAFENINIRNAMKAAVRGFLTDIKVRDIIIDSSPDDPNPDIPPQ